jgi:hypothetical protein
VSPTLKDTLYAILFNVMGYLHEIEKGQLAKINPNPTAKAGASHTQVVNPGLRSSMGGLGIQRDVKG